MDARHWDDRYRNTEDSVWTSKPNRFVVAALEHERPGRALDLGAGEGRNAIWLARHGWRVTAVDFAAVGLARAAEWAAQAGLSERLTTEVADVTTYHPAGPCYDAVVVAYLQLTAAPRAKAMATAAMAVAPGGLLVVVAHDSSNLHFGVGGPRDPAVLYTPDDVVADITTTTTTWDICEATVVERDVANATHPARDALVLARRVS